MILKSAVMTFLSITSATAMIHHPIGVCWNTTNLDSCWKMYPLLMFFNALNSVYCVFVLVFMTVVCTKIYIFCVWFILNNVLFLMLSFQSKWHIRILFIEILSCVVYAFLVDHINKLWLLAIVIAVADFIMKWYFLVRVRLLVLHAEHLFNLNERRHMRRNCSWSCKYVAVSLSI